MLTKHQFFLALGLLSLTASAVPSQAQSAPPGLPTNQPPPFVIDIPSNSTTPLPFPVVPGDVVLLENPNGGPSPSNWSDVLRFSNNQNVAGAPLGSALMISDLEGGFPANFALDPNHTFINEIGFPGTGSDAVDFTDYSPLGAVPTPTTQPDVYRIFSDSPAVELPELPETPEPGAWALLMLGLPLVGVVARRRRV